MNAAIRDTDNPALVRRAGLELDHARLRLEIALTEIRWAIDRLQAGEINATGAITLLNEAMDELLGDGP